MSSNKNSKLPNAVILCTRKVSFNEIENLLETNETNTRTVREACRKLLDEERELSKKRIKAETGKEMSLRHKASEHFRECFPCLTYHYNDEEISKERWSELISNGVKEWEYKLNVEYDSKIKSLLKNEKGESHERR